VYDRPVNAFVAGFIGSPSMNLVPGTVERDGDGIAVALAGSRLALGDRAAALRDRVGSPVTVGIRPEDIHADGRGGGSLEVEVVRVESLGSELMAYVTPAGTQDGAQLTARLDRKAEVEQGAPARFSVDLERVYLFDAGTGEAIARSRP
jgi:ABC-type sugar transport system ATPase subunit